MKKIAFILCLLFVTGISKSQSYNNPESIVYEPVKKRYFISNKGGNTIVQLDSLRNLTNFVTTGLNEPKGLLIVGDTLISINSTSVQGFLLSNASRVINISIAGSVFMNDATTDGKGNLYITDSETNKVYKLSLHTGSYSTLINPISSPNGLLFDEKNNSILICGNSYIRSYNLTNASSKTKVSASFSDLDGLARDNCGNIYVSSWGSSSVYVFDSLFQNPPTKISTGHNGPADISINQKEQILTIPNFKSNTISLINLNMGCAEINYLSPQNKSNSFYDSTKIDWEDVAGVSKYELQYSIDSTFNSSLSTVQTANSDTIIKGLAINSKYYWRVRTIGVNNKNIFNGIWAFTAKESAVLAVSASALSINDTANSTATFTITSNTSWNIISDQPWITLNKISGSGNESVILTATANSTANTRTAIITVSGNGVTSQTIIVTQSAGTTDVQDITDGKTKIYPNPTSGLVDIVIKKSLESNFKIEVYNDLGNVIQTIEKQKDDGSAQVDLTGFPSGVYLIIILLSDESFRTQVIKK